MKKPYSVFVFHETNKDIYHLLNTNGNRIAAFEACDSADKSKASKLFNKMKALPLMDEVCKAVADNKVTPAIIAEAKLIMEM